MTEPRNSNAMSVVSSPIGISSPSEKLYAVITNRFGDGPPNRLSGDFLAFRPERRDKH